MQGCASSVLFVVLVNALCSSGCSAAFSAITKEVNNDLIITSLLSVILCIMMFV